MLAWDGVIKASSLQDVVVGGVLAVVGSALSGAAYHPDLIDILDEVGCETLCCSVAFLSDVHHLRDTPSVFCFDFTLL